MKEGALWMALVLLACFVAPLNRDRYQATSIGNKAFILDKHTGEAWVSIKNRGEYMNLAEMEMVPVQYSSYQYTWGSKEYLPEDTRNNKHAEWSTVVEREISQLFKPKSNIWDALEDAP
ncbi:MAG: hypothetical protein JSR37_08515 [Verrucomicrobia bacterium]|nr:hypothetical protein [Verrucomicrobiota bacterium]MBS0636729.1 hypothetical protein [Verrucomicrobiota bacterium]